MADEKIHQEENETNLKNQINEIKSSKWYVRASTPTFSSERAWAKTAYAICGSEACEE
jgi:hypothetical protein